MVPKKRTSDQSGLWQRATNPNFNIVKKLASKLLSEVESINEDTFFGENFSLADEVEKFEADLIRHALTMTNGYQVGAARLLGIKTTTLNCKIKRFGIPPRPNSKLNQ